ncbi:MAG TPA: chromosome segregation protein SMC [Clostridiaceae bacterium]|nr:chromosome segregation protein SMC [Clostridiaceae bacterium]
MRLKQLEIQGFKSFADKVVLEFDSGITAIVGPNGSGKSNIADAIRWVLGEQSVKTLRGSKMEDVIFAGTEHRKTMGFAEVSLVIDNYNKSLPLEYSEVKITRRLFRSGESEYFINKTPCRLKDITELFLDTGIGKEGYSIIGQSRIDEILSTKSEDRRYIFEEASGIMKYKLRKIEAEKKLESTRQNLVRINDIINELESQLEPLKIQAETARKYLSLRESLKVLEVNLYLTNIEKIKNRVNELQNLISDVEKNIRDENLKIESLNRENETRSLLVKSRSERLDATRQEFFELEKNLEKLNAAVNLNNEKISNYDKNNKRLENEISQINDRILKIDREAQLQKSRLDQLNLQLGENLARFSHMEEEFRLLSGTLDQDEKVIEEMKSSLIGKLELLSDKKTQVNNIENQINIVSERKAKVAEEIKQIGDAYSTENVKKEAMYTELEQLGNAIEKFKAKISKLNSEKENKNKKLQELRNHQTKIKSEKQFKESRYNMLKNMENNLEGYNRSVRVILQKCKESDEFGDGIHGALAQLITVDKKYEIALEMTLGGALQNIVTTSEEDAKKAIEYLKTNRMGRATFLPISSVTGTRLDEHTISRIKKYKGFCGIASDLVEYSSLYNGIILSFLGKVAVVDNIDTGIEMAREFNYSFKIVTLDGDILSTRGSITGGDSTSRSSGILSRGREIASLYHEILQLAKDEMNIEEKISSIINSLNELDKAVNQETSMLHDAEITKARNENYIRQIADNINRMQSKSEMLEQESLQLAREMEEIFQERDKYIKEQKDIEKEIEDMKRIISENSDKHREDQIARDKLNEKLTDCKISISTIKESIEMVREGIEKLNNDKISLEKSIEVKNQEICKNIEKIKSLAEENEGLSEQIKKIDVEKVGKTLEIDNIEEERKSLEEELLELSNKIKDKSNNVTLLKEEFNRLEVRMVKAEAELEAVQNRLWDEYELTYNNALSLKKDIGSITQAQKDILELRNEIKNLGTVNVAAIDDYVKTKERYEFMTTQRDDMEQAQEKLYRVISEMTVLMKQKFIEQFRKINENFNLVYRQLFDGGKAELKLVDEENILESGIDIEVQPPGKKLQNMMLLSGGERAFTAIALLFAILKLKPVPFCVLDEIEAALDDANVYRFAKYLKDYSEETQFIMVTHRKGTMEVSDSLYGVTMQERGVSGIVSLKLGEKAS